MRNVATGNGATFDGETLTNGFHPLCFALLLPIHLATEDRTLAIHLALTLGAVLSAAAVLLLFDTLRRLTRSLTASTLAALFLAIHPRFIGDAVSGIETSLGHRREKLRSRHVR